MDILKLQLPAGANFDGQLPPEAPGLPGELATLDMTGRDDILFLLRQGDTLWLRYRATLKQIELGEHEPFRLAYSTPAKGPGFITLMASKKGQHGYATVFDIPAFESRAYQKAQALARKLGQYLGYPVEEDGWGADC